jgi:hypothetical protein
MSILAQHTERKAVLQIAKTLRLFSTLDFLMLSAVDATLVRQAENLLKGIIENNGYAIRFSKKRGTRIIKTKDQ